MNKENITTKKIEDYIKVFNKKFLSFQSRSPVFFTFQYDVYNVYLQKEASLNIHKFKIDYEKDVSIFIHEIHEYLRHNLYPKMIKVTKKVIEPSIEDIQKRIDDYDESFEQAYYFLSNKIDETTFIIDKIDKIRNRVVVIEKDKEKQIKLYQLSIPVIIFLNKIVKTSENEYDLYKEFNKISYLIKREYK